MSKSFSLSNSSQKPPFFAVLMYSLYGHPRYFKFKRNYQQYAPCFQTIFPFFMTMILINKLSLIPRSHWLDSFPNNLKSSQVTELLQTSIWSLTEVDKISFKRFPVRSDMPCCSETLTFMYLKAYQYMKHCSFRTWNPKFGKNAQEQYLWNYINFSND